MNPEVSVIIPTYNRARLLQRAINSVLNQKYRDFEIIVIDDSLEDDSEEVVKSFHCSSIRYFRRTHREDIAAKRNLGIKLSKGTYVAFIDDDDEWLPKKLALQIDQFKKSDKNVGMVHTNSLVDNGSIKVPYHREDIVDQSTCRLLENNFVCNSTSMIKKDCFDRIGYLDEELPYCEDWDFYIRLSKKFKLEYVCELTAILHWADFSSVGRGSLDLCRVTRGFQIFFAKHWKDYAGMPTVLSKNLKYIGINLNLIGEKKLARSYLLKAYTTNPKDFSAIISFCFVVLENSVIDKKLNLTNFFRRLARGRLTYLRRLAD